jgi:hypothetical protein
VLEKAIWGVTGVGLMFFLEVSFWLKRDINNNKDITFLFISLQIVLLRPHRLHYRLSKFDNFQEFYFETVYRIFHCEI